MGKALQAQLDAGKLEDQTIRLSHPFDRFLWLESDSVDALVSELVVAIEGHYPPRKRAAKDEAIEKMAFFVKVLLLNLLLLQKFPRKTLLAIPKSASAYSYNGSYDQPLLSYKTVMRAYDALVALGYVEVVTQGHWDKEKQVGEVTRIVAAPKLRREFDSRFPQRTVFFMRHPNEETIYQKNADKKYVDYKDTPYSQKARENLRTINANLSRHWYDLELSNERFEEFYQAWEAKRKRKSKGQNRIEQRPHDDMIPAVVNFSNRSLYRVFNNGGRGASKKNFKQGGRFYGGWWEQIPSDYRRYITIEQKNTVELDYSNLHPHMLYAREGKTLEGDAYEVEGIHKDNRDYIKKAFNQMLNGDGKQKGRTPEGFKDSGVGMKWSQVQDRVRERHQPIAHYFNTGYGLDLQRQDAEILERVLLHFAKMGYPCLPIHDSVIIHHALKDELGAAMVAAYKQVTGQEIPLKLKDNYAFFVERNPGKGWDTDSIEDILGHTLSSQYESRWVDWLEHKNML